MKKKKGGDEEAFKGENRPQTVESKTQFLWPPIRYEVIIVRS